MCANNICRICGNITREEDPIDIFQSNNKEVLDKIKDLTGIRLKKNLNLPKLMCCICKKDLNDAFKFRENFLQVQASFRINNLKVNKKETHNDLIEATEFIQVLVYKEKNLIKKREYAEDEEKEINIDESADKNRSYNASKENRNEVNALELKPYEENTIDDTKIVKEEIVCNSEDVQLDVSKVESEKEDNEVQYDGYKSENEILTLNTFKRGRKNKKRAYVTKETQSSELKIKSKKKHEENPNIFICDQCGNHFTCRHHFKLHLRRHTGDKRCACELCPDKFFTSSELRRHMRRHTGERPFACKYCERRFTDYSTRIKHERTHTNERPFMCSQCGKSFTTSYILKNHMLTHTGERQFKCEICNRAFTRRTHLVVHFRSIMHKQAVEKKKPIPLDEISRQNCLIQQPANTSTFIV